MAVVVRGLTVLVVGLYLTLASSGVGTARESEDAGIAQVVVVDSNNWREVDDGTAFLITTDGLALTAAHVVNQAVQDPSRYRLLVILGREFYGAEMLCSTHSTGAQYDRDVATIRLAAPAFPFIEWVYFRPGDQAIVLASARRGPMPKFSTLHLADDTNPSVGMAVRIPGYSHASTIPRIHTGVGIIRRTFSGTDGAPMIQIELTVPTQPGAIGSPILSPSGEVVGILTHGDGRTEEEGVSIEAFRAQLC